VPPLWQGELPMRLPDRPSIREEQLARGPSRLTVLPIRSTGPVETGPKQAGGTGQRADRSAGHRSRPFYADEGEHLRTAGVRGSNPLTSTI
jgi:hypothetical protein